MASKRNIVIASTFATMCGIASITTHPAVAQQTFRGCIGEKVGYVDACPAGMDYYYDCNFAHAHASNTDEAAANDWCINKKVFKRAGVQRNNVYGGDNCGYIIDTTTCQN